MTAGIPAVAAHLAAQHRSNHLIAFGGPGELLAFYRDEFFVTEVSPAEAVDLTDDQIDNAVVLCLDAESLLADAGPLLRQWRERAAALVLTTEGAAHLDGFADRLADAGLPPAFVGLTRRDALTSGKDTVLAIVEGARTAGLEVAPDGFRVLAVITGYNERDILPFTLRRLLADGVEVLYIDNWSTDGTLEAVQAEFGDRISTMRYPDAPPDEVALVDLLTNAERCAVATGATWIVHDDADEIRESPWPGVGLRDALWNVQQRGFNAVNFHVLVYRPTTAADIPTDVDPTLALTHWDHLRRPSAMVHVKAWRNTGASVGLGETGGHEVTFPGRLVFPYQFLLRHYPLRSVAHGRRKVLDERLSRWSRAETEQRKWHHQYDQLAAAGNFVWDAADLQEWDARVFARDCLTERLFGIGVHEGPEPFPLPQPANPPTAARAAWVAAAAERRDLTAQLTACQQARAADRRKLSAARKRAVAPAPPPPTPADSARVPAGRVRRLARRVARLTRRRLTGSR